MAYIALFDILGFGQIIESHGIEEVKALFGRRFNSLVSFSVRLTAKSREQVTGKRTTPVPKSLRFSDTILLWTESETKDSLADMIVGSYNLMMMTLSRGIPLRGAVTRGELHVSKSRSFYVGEGMLRAHRLEQAQDWAGVVIDHQRVFDTRGRREWGKIEELIREYKVPMKDVLVQEWPCINWPNDEYWKNRVHVESCLRRFFPKLDWSARRKVDATLAFYDSWRTSI